MDILTEKQRQLLDVLSSYGRVAVAFSAGVDSTVVAKAAQLACGADAVAVTADSPSLASGELDEAKQLAQQIGIRHQIVRTQEFDQNAYRANAGDRCYHCKAELYTRLEGMQEALDVDVIVNGANLDDRGDYRPGMQAASEHAVRSPLIEAGFTKQDVRDLAREWDLPVWDKPASPCLSSRIAYGVEVTQDRVRMVDAAEQFLKQTLGLRELRVRLEANELARIEVPIEDIPRLAEPTIRNAIDARLRSLGFRTVTLDLAGFRSGNLNEVLPLETLIASGGRQSPDSST
ncbi:MAG: ATP-dependent sacrificial sulfur transferase LarE [Planctomycetaceae bacterium]|nr:ATP-dependent sacrificial sulfur transferase LarE [Planctomycetaceae bacterium]